MLVRFTSRSLKENSAQYHYKSIGFESLFDFIICIAVFVSFLIIGNSEKYYTQECENSSLLRWSHVVIDISCISALISFAASVVGYLYLQINKDELRAYKFVKLVNYFRYLMAVANIICLFGILTSYLRKESCGTLSILSLAYIVLFFFIIFCICIFNAVTSKKEQSYEALGGKDED